MIPYKQSENVKHTFLEALYNRHFTKGRTLVENVFGILFYFFQIIIVKKESSYPFPS